MKTAFLRHGIFMGIALMHLTLSFAQKDAKVNRSSSTNRDSHHLNVNENRSSNNGESLINYKSGDDRYTIKTNGDMVTELQVNSRKIPADSFYVYSAIVGKIMEQLKQDREQAAEDRRQAEKDRAQANLDRQQAEKDREQATRDREQSKRDRAQAEKEQPKSKQDQAQAELDRKQANKDREQALKDREQAKKDREQAEKDRAQAGEDRKRAELDRKQAEEDRALVKLLIEELVKEHLVSDEKSISSLVLSDDEFTINGNRQTEALHSKFKAKYLKKANGGISYRNTSGGSEVRYNSNR